MPHQRSQRKLGRTSSHRLALFRNQLSSLVAAEHIVTTLPKAKELRPLAERVITQGKRGTLHARRLAGRWIADRELLRKLFEEIAPRMQERPGGYLRIVKLGHRKGDGAEMAVLELVDFKHPEAKPEEEKKGKGRGKEKDAEGGEAAEARPKGKKTAPQQRRAEKRTRTDTKAKGSGKAKAPRKVGSE
jgi:large subunit ribosomal protein L17